MSELLCVFRCHFGLNWIICRAVRRVRMSDCGRWFAVSASAKDRSVGTRARQKTPQERVQERDRLIEVALKFYFVKCFKRQIKEKLYVCHDP